MKSEFLHKWYTRTVGIFFVLVFLSLIIDIVQFGHRPETWHKIFHVILGIIIISNWNNKNFYRHFCLINGAFFIFVAAFGWTFPNFGDLDAFNFVDTVLHSIVGITGLIIGIKK